MPRPRGPNYKPMCATRALVYLAKKKYGIPYHTTRAAVHAMAEHIVNELLAGRRVRFEMLGTFAPHKTKGRGKVNVHLHGRVKETLFPDFIRIGFRAGKHMKDQLKKGLKNECNPKTD